MDHIEWDVREAERLGYGCHYGRYKVDHPHTREAFEAMEQGDTPQQPMQKTPPEKRCCECGNMFVPNHGSQRYCSIACNNRAIQRRYREKHPKGPSGAPVRNCAVCGEVYVTYKKAQMTCSRACGQIYRAQLKKQRRETSSEGES